MINHLRYTPAVYAVGKEYQIVCLTETNVLLAIEVNGKRYYDHSNGVIRCKSKSHKVNIPMCELDKSKEYKVICRKVAKRLGDFSETEDEVESKFEFKPIDSNKEINIYQVSDAHQKAYWPHNAAKFYGDNLNLLVINGDTFDYINEESDFDYLYSLIEEITHGNIPVIFAKGNHDNKGAFAECLEDYTPTRNGKTYYTFKLGRIWGLVLDEGENCIDESPEYGHTSCHHYMRLDETEYIKNVIKNAKDEYEDPEVEIRLIISHCAITNVREKPFDIEIPIYKEWVELINKNIKPHLMLSGHLHITKFCLPHDELDTLGQSCPVIIGANPVGWQTGVLTNYIGLAVTIDKNEFKTKFTDSSLKIHEENNFIINSK